MQLKACPLIVALFAFLSCLSTVIGQAPNTVNIRPRVAAAEPGLPAVRVTVDKNRVPLGEEVTFTLSPGSVVVDPLYTITIYFGDGARQQTRQTQIVHLYRAAGNYTYAVLVTSSKSDPGRPRDPRDKKVPGVSLSAVPTPVAAGRPVSFTAQLAFGYPDIKYRFVFGDGVQTGWQDNSQTTHAYPSTGAYRAYVDIGVPDNGIVKQMGGSVRQPIQVTQPPLVTVDLTANPTSVEAKRPVTFIARVVPGDPNLKYRFAFGDGSRSSGWQDSSQTRHIYSLSGQYPAYVEAGLLSNGRLNTVATSNTKQVSVTPGLQPPPTPTPGGTPTPGVTPTPAAGITPTPTPGITLTSTRGPTSSSSDAASTNDGPGGSSGNWWKYLLIAALVLFGGYQASNWFFPPRPTFYPHVDPGVSQLGTDGGPLAFDFQIHLNPNITGGDYGFDPHGASFIKSERRGDG